MNSCISWAYYTHWGKTALFLNSVPGGRFTKPDLLTVLNLLGILKHREVH